MIAQELEVSLHMAFVEARQKRHEFITVEHLLLAIQDNLFQKALAMREASTRAVSTYAEFKVEIEVVAAGPEQRKKAARISPPKK